MPQRRRRRATETICTYNVLFSNSAKVIGRDISALTKKASVLVLNEVAPHGEDAKGVDLALDGAGWLQTGIRKGDNRIAWDSEVWQASGFDGVAKIADGADDAGKPYKFMPTRYLMWQGLHHVETGAKHLFYGTHIIAGYDRPKGHWSAEVEEFRDRTAMEAMVNIVRLVAVHMSRDAHGSVYDHHHLLGDLNSRQKRTKEWWYPSRILDGFFVPDTMPNSIDWVLHSWEAKANGLKVLNRWAERHHSDHPAHLKRVSFPRG